ncbi:MAG TPA: hypothetical protein VG841_08705 [Caulobacterales bacterium]|nr:hypothetical protein [Caulobacterales bacterium]
MTETDFEAAISTALRELRSPVWQGDVAQQEAAGAWFGRGIVIHRNRYGEPLEINAEQRDIWLEKAKAGDAEAERVVLGAAAYVLRHLWHRDDPLAAYAAEALAKSIEVDPNRRRQLKNADRDLRIAMAIRAVKDEHNMPATRNAASRDKADAAPCACSVVVEALGRLDEHKTEDAVTKIWAKAKELH